MMNSELEDYYAYWINNIEGIGNKKVNALINYYGDYEKIYNADKNSLYEAMRNLSSVEDFYGAKFSKRDLDNILKWKNDTITYAQYKKMKNKGILFTYPLRKDYPDKLKNLSDMPQIIYYKGKLPDANKKSVAIIGARNCSEYGKQLAYKLGEILGEAEVDVISGLALGVDTYGHKGTLDANGSTYAIMGCGVDICYPQSNIGLYMDIQKRGGIISEYALGTVAKAGNFPVRNRIISGLSDITVVVEAKKRSGSLITVEAALSQGKEVAAIPGRITDILSEGCNELIKMGAGVITKPEDILEMLGVDSKKKNNKEIELKNEEKIVFDNLCINPKEINIIIEETGIEASKVIKE